MDMDDLNQAKERYRRPIAVWVFGVLNIVFGCYFLVRMVPSWAKLIVKVYKETGHIFIFGLGIWNLLLFAFTIGLAVWIIVLGYGLLMMKRWARRGSCMYARIQIVFIVITLGSLFISLAIGWTSPPKDICVFLNLNNGLALIGWIYMVLLLIFMKTGKVKRAFAED